MKPYSAVAAAAAFVVIASAPALASASAFSIDFEADWNANNQFAPDLDNYYNGGTASNGASGPNRGVSFVNVSGLSNQSPDFTYYANAPSPLGTAFAHDNAYLNVASGVGNALAFYYSSPNDVVGAVRAFSGLNGTGTLLGTIDLVANFIDGSYDNWSLATLRFSGVARSFDFTASADAAGVLFDNVATVPEPGMGLMLALGGAAALFARRSRRRIA